MLLMMCLRSCKMSKYYQVNFKDSDVINTLSAESKEEAEKLANEVLEKNEMQGNSKCYEIKSEAKK